MKQIIIMEYTTIYTNTESVETNTKLPSASGQKRHTPVWWKDTILIDKASA